jgi:predicted RNase H-like HicB family nuclease
LSIIAVTATSPFARAPVPRIIPPHPEVLCAAASGVGTIHLAIPSGRSGSMQTTKYVRWQDGDVWIGFLQDCPDYWTQGETLEDLKEHLRDLFADLTSGEIPGVRKVDGLVVA